MEKKQFEFTTQALNLRGDIKHITEKTENQTWELEFEDNRLFSVKDNRSSNANYQFEYEGKKLTGIHNRGYSVDLEIFSLNFELRLPLYNRNDIAQYQQAARQLAESDYSRELLSSRLLICSKCLRETLRACLPIGTQRNTEGIMDNGNFPV